MITLVDSKIRLDDYKKADYHFDVVLGNDVIGVAVVHHFGCGMSYIKNLAYIEIFTPFQRKGYGSMVLKELIRRFGQLALFSVEEKEKENFYLKNGFNKLSIKDANGYIGEWRKYNKIPTDILKKCGNLFINGEA